MTAAPGTTRRLLAEGCRLFDEGRFFDAHETWEEAWRVETGAVRELLHGLIQVAAGFHKGLVQGRPAGMVKLLERGLGRARATGGLGLVDLDAFLEEVAPWLDAARRWAVSGERPELPLPRLTGSR